MRNKLTSKPSSAAARAISFDRIDKIFASVGEKLREGLSRDAEQILVETIEKYDHTPDNLAHLKRLLSFTLETTGRYRESLEIIREFADEAELEKLLIETRVRVLTQLAIAHNNNGDQPKAATLLKDTLESVETNHLRHLAGGVNIGLARVYRKLAEFPICRDYAQKALEHFRDDTNWLGMAEAYREIANSYHQEGNSEKSIENFKQGIGIIGENSAPFMLGKLYTDMSGAYWFLRKPQDGIACLEKSIEFFNQTAHSLNSVIAYNNLGINLVLIGEWDRAEQMINRALEIAERENTVHVAGIYESKGELCLLRRDLDAAEEWLDKAVAFAKERKHAWYTVQSMRNLARCYLVQGRVKRAIAAANETIERSREFGDKHYTNMARLVLAEAYLTQHHLEECEEALVEIEENDPSADFYVLGSIQRIRGLAALEASDNELAIHHFSRALTVFETGEDVYHIALMHQHLGTHLDAHSVARARGHLSAALDIYKRLGRLDRVSEVERELERLRSTAPGAGIGGGASARAGSPVSQLLTVRLAESTASRELLFRELVAVLQQEGLAKRIIIAQRNEQNRLFPFITHGVTPQESNDIINKLATARERNEEKAFAKVKNLAIYHLRASAAPSATLIVGPQSGAALSDSSSLAPLLRVVELGMDVIGLREKSKAAPAESDSSPYTSNSIMPGFIHSSPAMSMLVEEVNKIRSSDVTVLVTGESGTGKELVSRAIHALSNRKDRIFVPFNCTAVPKELADANLFGYRKGSFTGAVTDSPGTIRTANGGTLFLDEIGDLPLDVQPKLLRFLQEGEIQPLGEKQPIKVDVRIIAATNMPLEEKVADGSFREDLFYRLNVIRLHVPPLRERRSEIPPMVNYYINHYSQRFNKHDLTITPQAVDMLMVSTWEGNVRQLCNEIQRVVARAVDGEVITPQHLSPELKRSAKPLAPIDPPSGAKPIASYDNAGFTPFSKLPDGGTLENAVSELEMQLIKASLTRNSWNISRVASELGLTRRGLYLKLTRYGIQKAA